jgi:MFS family permease
MGATLLLFFSFQSLFPTLSLYIASIGGTPAHNGLSTWVFALSGVLVRPLAGLLADRWGRKPVMVLGAILFGGGPVLYRMGSTIPALLGARAVHGMGMALFSTTYQAFIADLLPPGRYGEGLGLANAASVVTMAAGPPFGEWVAQTSGFKSLFLSLGAVGGLGVLVTLALPGAGRATRPRFSLESPTQDCPGDDPISTSTPRLAQAGLRPALRQPGVRAGTLGMALLGIPYGAYIVFLPLLAAERGLGGTGWVFAAYALASTLVQPLAGRAADRWGTGRIALAGLGLVGLAVAGLTTIASRGALLGLAVLFGVGYGAARAGLDAWVQGTIGPAMRGTAAAVQYASHDLVIGCSSWALGWMACSTGYGAMYAVAGGITLVGVVAGRMVLGRGDGSSGAIE